MVDRHARRLRGMGRRWLGSLALAAAMAAGPVTAQDSPTATPAPLFDGSSFKGWEGNLGVFRIEGGAIVGGSLTAKIPRNEFLCTTRSFADFELKLSVKLVGGDRANAGIQFRTRRIPDHHEVSGYQADMGTGWWGALYDESRRNKVLSGPDQERMRSLVRQEDWNEYVIRARGDRIQLQLNGVQTVDYREPDAAVPRDGLICVQIHSGPPSEAWYKDITIQELSPSGGPR